MYLVAISCFCVLTILSETIAVDKLPPFVTTCKRTDPELSKCWRSIVENLRPYLEKGIPEFNLPPINYWPMSAKFGLSGETFYEEIQHVTSTGGKNFEILDNTISLQDNVITLKLRFPKLHFDVLSKVNGTILNYHFDNYGNIDGSIDDLILDYKLKGHRTVKKEDEFISFDDNEVDVKFSKYTLTSISYLESREDNERFIAECTKYRNFFEPVVKQLVIETISPAILEILKYVYGNYPLNVLHPMH